jgi:hypothetical protein
MEINARHPYKIDTGEGHILKGMNEALPLQYVPAEGESACTGSSSGNWNLFSGNRSINRCEKRLTVSVFGMLDLARFRTSNRSLAFSGAPSASLHESFAALEPYALRNRLKRITLISHRPETSHFGSSWLSI